MHTDKAQYSLFIRTNWSIYSQKLDYIMLAIIISSLCIVQVFGATTVKPTLESVEHERHTFKYDPISHHMMVKNHRKCYVFPMSDQESVDVHTTHGLHALEIKLINIIDDTTATFQNLTHDQLSAISKLLEKNCKKSHMVIIFKSDEDNE